MPSNSGAEMIPISERLRGGPAGDCADRTAGGVGGGALSREIGASSKGSDPSASRTWLHRTISNSSKRTVASNHLHSPRAKKPTVLCWMQYSDACSLETQLRRYVADPKHVEIDIHFTSREHDMRRVVDGRGQSTCCMKRVRKVEAELPAVSVFNGCGEIYAVRRMSEVALKNAAWLSYKVMIRTADRQGFRLTGKADDQSISGSSSVIR